MEKLIDPEKGKALLKLLDDSKRIVLTCHVRPDGDAIGSTLGLWHLLRSLGKEPTVVIPDKAPSYLSFLPGFNDIAVFTRHDPFCKRVVDEADLIICCDFNIPSRQDELAPLIQSAPCRKVMIDHHQDPGHFADLEISYPDMSSTCELVFRLIASMGLFTEVNKDCATCLLTGIITDTRNFNVNINHNDIYEILMRILDMGINKKAIVKEVMETKSLDALRLESFALLNRMEIFPDHKAAVISLSASDLKEFNYQKGDTEGLVNKPLEVKGIVYSIFLREDNDCVKVSARSINNFPVSEICKDLYGGGGHLQASGAEYHGSLEDCRRLLVESMPNYDKYLNNDK